MGQVRAFLDRIQGRLLAAFLMAIIGTLTIWYVGHSSLRKFAADTSRQIDQVYQASDFGNRLQAGIMGQIAVGERLLSAPTPETQATFDSLTIEVREAWAKYNTADSLRLTENSRKQLKKVAFLHTQIEAAYRTRSQESVAAVGPAVDETRAILNGLQSTTMTQLAAMPASLLTYANERTKLMGILLLVMALIAGYFIWSTFAAIDKPLNKLVIAANQLGEGDLNVSLNGRMPEEFRVLSGAFNSMADRFRNIVGETVSAAQKIGSSAHDLSSISEQVAASSGQVSTAMVGITSGAEEQASGLRTVNEALEDIRRRAEEIDSSTD
ncbi:MAG TPA: methyl-accepting chemotaxis protein, partial [Longimicrobiales bacterium]